MVVKKKQKLWFFFFYNLSTTVCMNYFYYYTFWTLSWRIFNLQEECSRGRENPVPASEGLIMTQRSNCLNKQNKWLLLGPPNLQNAFRTSVLNEIFHIKMLILITVHPQLSEQAELNLKFGHSDIPKIRIIEDGLLTLFHAPQRAVFWHDWKENHGIKENYYLYLILMLITTKFVNKIQNLSKRKLHQLISSEKRIEIVLCLWPSFVFG